MIGNAPDEEHIDPHGECAAEIYRLQDQLRAQKARIEELEGRTDPSGKETARAAIKGCLAVVESKLPLGNESEAISELLSDIIWELRGLHGPFIMPKGEGK